MTAFASNLIGVMAALAAASTGISNWPHKSCAESRTSKTNSLLHPSILLHQKDDQGTNLQQCDPTHAPNSGRSPSFRTLKDYTSVLANLSVKFSPQHSKNWYSYVQTHLYYSIRARDLRISFFLEFVSALQARHNDTRDERHKRTILDTGVSFGRD
jgi:hypothetical protein